jgi:hypothetical protein
MFVYSLETLEVHGLELCIDAENPFWQGNLDVGHVVLAEIG